MTWMTFELRMEKNETAELRLRSRLKNDGEKFHDDDGECDFARDSDARDGEWDDDAGEMRRGRARRASRRREMDDDESERER